MSLPFAHPVFRDSSPLFGDAVVEAKTWYRNRPIDTFNVQAASGGDGRLSYEFSGLPTGIYFSSITRNVYGRPGEFGSGTATVTATDGDGDAATLSFAWSVTLEGPPRVSVTGPATSATGGYRVYWWPTSGAASYELQERVDGGGWASAYSGDRTWTALSDRADGAYEYRVRACAGAVCSGWSGTGGVAVRRPPDLEPDFGAATVEAKSWTAGDFIENFTVPAASGGDGVLSYAISGLPDGLDWLSSTRYVYGRPGDAGSGTATVTATDAAGGLPEGVEMSAGRAVSGAPAAAGAGTATVTAADADGDAATLRFAWTVAADSAPSFGSAALPDRTWVAGKDIPGFTVPSAAGGNGDLTYGALGLPDGVRLVGDTWAMEGAPTAAGMGAARVAARDADGDLDVLGFGWTVEADSQPAFGGGAAAGASGTGGVPPFSWIVGEPVAGYTLPAAAGGNAPVSYGAAGLPEGVAVTPERKLTGTPLATGTGAAEFTARDADGDAATLVVEWSVAAPPAGAAGAAGMAGMVLSVDSNPTAGADFTVTGTYSGGRTFEWLELKETGPWGHVTTHRPGGASFTLGIENKVNGAYTYRLTGCRTRLPINGFDVREVCEPLGGPLTVTVAGPAPEAVGAQLGRGFVVRRGDIDGDGRADLFIGRASAPTGGGMLHRAILRQTTTGAFEPVAPTAPRAATVASWPVATGVTALPGDYNLDGFVDVLLRGLGGLAAGAPDGILYAPGRLGGSPVILNAVDDKLRNFLSEVSAWTADPNYFLQATTTVWIPIRGWRRSCFGGRWDGVFFHNAFCAWYPETVGYQTVLRPTNSSPSARQFAAQFGLVDGRINPNVRLGSERARNIDRILEDMLGVEVLNGRLERSCAGRFDLDSHTSMDCGDSARIGRIILVQVAENIAGDTASNTGPDGPRTRSLSGVEKDFIRETFGGWLSEAQIESVEIRELTIDEIPAELRSGSGCFVQWPENNVINCSENTYRDDFLLSEPSSPGHPLSQDDEIEDASLFLHEITHVWQYLTDAEMADGLEYVYRDENGNLLAGEDGLPRRFQDFGQEQQAEIIMDRFRLCKKVAGSLFDNNTGAHDSLIWSSFKDILEATPANVPPQGTTYAERAEELNSIEGIPPTASCDFSSNAPGQ